MIDIHTTDFPPFIEEEFERLMIPGGEKGFAISFASFKRKQGIALGFQGDVAISISYSGDEYAVDRRKPISSEVFESLYRLVPDLVKRSGFIGAEDILDGESYLVKWASDTEKT